MKSKKNPALNLSDLIQRDPSVFVKQSGGIGQITEISIRGTRPNHTLILKDGARLNSQNHLAAIYPSFLDSSDLEQIEILKVQPLYNMEQMQLVEWFK